MIKSLSVDNFKGLDGTKIPFAPFTIIIGNNASGKSTVLQALSFLKYCCISHASKFMDDRGFSVADIASKLSNRRTMSFQSEIELDGRIADWKISFSIDKTKNTIALHSERVMSTDTIYMQYDGTSRSYFRNESTGEKVSIMPGDYDCSILRIMDTGKNENRYPLLCSIKKYFAGLEDLALLSPASMRRNSQGRSESIGLSGEKLGAFIKSLSQESREALIRDVQSFQPTFHSVTPKIKQYGWVHLEAKEMYDGKTIELTAPNISDGMLRIIATCALKYASNTKSGVILLDEIEDGINNEHLERLVQILCRIKDTRNVQVIATTHNTVLLDYWMSKEEKDGRLIVFLIRDALGRTVARSLFDARSLQEKLDYMYPGEIVLNMTNSEIWNLLEGE